MYMSITFSLRHLLGIRCKFAGCADSSFFLRSGLIFADGHFSEVVKSHLPDFLDWAVRIVASKECDPDSVNHQLGALAALSAIYKHGKREDLKTEASTVLKVRLNEVFLQCCSQLYWMGSNGYKAIVSTTHLQSKQCGCN